MEILKTVMKVRDKIAIIAVLLSTLYYCSGGPDTFGFGGKDTIAGKVNDNIITNVKIDKGKTYQAIFYLKEREECIRVSAKSLVYDIVLRNMAPVETFFVLEKAVDVSHFKGGKETEYFIELAKNYDGEWNRERYIRICSSEMDPVRRLDKGLYRIRFTVFRQDEFEYEIEIYTGNGIEKKSL